MVSLQPDGRASDSGAESGSISWVPESIQKFVSVCLCAQYHLHSSGVKLHHRRPFGRELTLGEKSGSCLGEVSVVSKSNC